VLNRTAWDADDKAVRLPEFRLSQPDQAAIATSISSRNVLFLHTTDEDPHRYRVKYALKRVNCVDFYRRLCRCGANQSGLGAPPASNQSYRPRQQLLHHALLDELRLVATLFRLKAVPRLEMELCFQRLMQVRPTTVAAPAQQFAHE
jgi:hypothetical protein